MTMGAGNQKRQIIYPKSISFDEKKITLLLNIDEAVLDFGGIAKLAAKNSFDKKTKFHITVVGFRGGAVIKQALDKFPEDRKQGVLQKIRSLIEETTWGFTLLPQRYHIQKDYTFSSDTNSSTEHRETYIQMVSMPDMVAFYVSLNSILGTHLEPPPPHLTLYTRGSNRERAKAGIGINSQEEFSKLKPQPLD